MLSALICELQRMGNVILFGSVMRPNKTLVGDIDIALIVSDGHSHEARTLVRKAVEKLGLYDFTFLQNLLSYDQHAHDRNKDQFIHILLCERRDLASGHPIVDSLVHGQACRVEEAA